HAAPATRERLRHELGLLGVIVQHEDRLHGRSSLARITSNERAARRSGRPLHRHTSRICWVRRSNGTLMPIDSPSSRPPVSAAGSRRTWIVCLGLGLFAALLFSLL